MQTSAHTIELLRTYLVATVTVCAAIVFVAVGVHALFWAPQPEVAVPALAANAPARHAAQIEKPARLIIPALDIDAKIDATGLTAAGNMGTPPNFTDTAWYEYGSIPGQQGSAVIDGHVDNGLGLAGVFKHLNEIVAGDDIYVVTSGGEQLHFVVNDIASYPYDAVPTSLVFGRTDAARLNLITCDGSWVGAQRTYDHRFVVFATLVTS